MGVAITTIAPSPGAQVSSSAFGDAVYTDLVNVANALPGMTGTPASTTSNGTPTPTGSTTETRDAVLGNYTFTSKGTGYYYQVVMEGLVFNGAGSISDTWALHIRDGGASTPTAASPLLAERFETTMLVGSGGRRDVGFSRVVTGLAAGLHTLSFFAVLLTGGASSAFTPLSPGAIGGSTARNLYVLNMGLGGA